MDITSSNGPSPNHLQTTIVDLTIIHSLIPTIPPLPITSTTTLVRVSIILYLPYLLLTYFVSLRVLVGLVGTLLLSWRASWACTIRYRLWHSAWVRWSVYRAWSLLTGEPLPPLTLFTTNLHVPPTRQFHPIPLHCVREPEMVGST